MDLNKNEITIIGIEPHPEDKKDGYGCEQSMSRKGTCWDNTPMGSFFSRLKVELVYPNNYKRVEE